jgi:hypothetical protein
LGGGDEASFRTKLQPSLTNVEGLMDVVSCWSLGPTSFSTPFNALFGASGVIVRKKYQRMGKRAKKEDMWFFFDLRAKKVDPGSMGHGHEPWPKHISTLVSCDPFIYILIAII